MSDAKKLTLLGRKNSINVMKVLWCCDELGLPFERIDVGGKFGFENVPDYLQLNPNGRVPTIRDGDLTLWESNVIVRYLCEKHGRGTLWPAEPARRWEAEKWMDWQQAHVGANMMVLLRQLVRTPPEERDMVAVENARQTAAEAWKVADGNLAGRNFVTGDDFTMGDIPLGCMLYRWNAFDIERPPLPNLEAYYERLKTRPPFAEHVLIPLS